MGRFFETADPHFIRDFVQSPNLDLIRLVNAKKQKEYDDAVNTIALLDSPVGDIKYINDPREREIVEAKQKHYSDLVQGVLEKVQADPKNWRNHLGNIQGITKELKSDLLSGDLSKVQASYNNYERLMKDNEKNPYKQSAIQKEFEKWQKNPNRSLDNSFGYVKLVDRPKIDAEKLKLEADKLEQVNGKWINKETGVSYDRWQDAIQGAIMSDENYLPYVNQMEGYFGKKGFDLSQTPMFNLQGVKLKDGSAISLSDYENLKKLKDKRIEGAKPIMDVNQNSGWYGEGLIAKSKEYNQRELDKNDVWATEAALGNAMAIAKMKEAGDTYRTKLNINAKKELAGLSGNANVVSVVDNISKTQSMLNERFRYGAKNFADTYGLPLNQNDLDRFAKGGAANVIVEKIQGLSKLDQKTKNNLQNAFIAMQNEAMNANVIATNEHYTNIYGKEKADQISKSITNIIKNGESVIANKPILYEGVRYEKGLQDPKLLIKLGFSNSTEKQVMNKGFFGRDADNDWIPFNQNPTTVIDGNFTDKFTINSEKVSKKMTDEDGEYTVSQNLKQTINPLSHRAIINNPDKMFEKGGENYIMMEATTDNGKTITFSVPMEEFQVR